jgi:hypothetical protein
MHSKAPFIGLSIATRSEVGVDAGDGKFHGFGQLVAVYRLRTHKIIQDESKGNLVQRRLDVFSYV